MMQKSEYLDSELWTGGIYELAIPVEHTEGEKRFGNGIRALWNHPLISGIWREREDYPDNMLEIPAIWSGYGLLSLSEERTVGCEVMLIPEPESDWLDLCVPMGMLSRIFDLNYPPDPLTNPWMAQVDQIFVTIAEAIYREVAFSLALIGEEVSGYADEHTFRKEYLETGGYLLSPEFCIRLGIVAGGLVLPSGLRWFPHTFG